MTADDQHKRSNDSEPSTQPSETSEEPVSNLPNQSSEDAPHSDDRLELLHQAREFLASSAIRSQSVESKRQFLLKKGVSPSDVEELLSEAFSTPPPVPPRTYIPPTPPSTLPGLLISLAQSITYLSAASGVGLLLYHRYILPRISESYTARHSLRQHEVELLKRLNDDLRAVRPSATVESPENSPEAEKDPVLDGDVVHPPNIDSNTLAIAIEHLTETIRPDPTSSSAVSVSTSYSRTLQSLTDLNAYISSQTYLLPAASSFRLGSSTTINSRALGPAEEEVRKEIRALKGLVLNRRSFTPGSGPTA